MNRATVDVRGLAPDSGSKATRLRSLRSVGGRAVQLLRRIARSMIHLYAAMALAAVVPMAPCPSPRPRFATIAVNPATTVTAATIQEFGIALRATEDGGYRWRLQTVPATGAPARYDGEASLWDSAFTNLNRAPGAPPMVGGQATEVFMFTAMAPGSAKLTFQLFGPGKSVAAQTTTYTVEVVPNVMVC